MNRLNPMDAQFLDAEDEDPNTSMAIASTAVFEGPAPSYEEFLATVARRLPLVPLYRRKLRTVPLRLGPPVWVDDPHFDIRYHVRQTALPAPGADEQLFRLMARLMAQRLDRDYPLWEYWLVEGLAQGRWALISKVHHCMVDGVSGTDLYRVFFDAPPAGEAPAATLAVAPEGVVPEPAAIGEPSAIELAARAALDTVLLPVREVSALRGALASPADALRQAAGTVTGLAKMAGALRPAPVSSLSGRIGRQRRYACARALLADVKTIRRTLGGTVNDVVLAAISSGFRQLLLGRGEQPRPHMVPSLVPVSMRAPGEEDIYENRLTVIIANLPVHVANPIDRLTAVRTELATLKASGEAMVGEAMISLGRYTPFLLTSAGARIAYGLPQREIVTVTTNVPGPREPLYGMGRRLVEIIPYVPIAATLRTGIAIFSYCGRLTFGITGDYAANPDLDVLARGIETGIAELLAAAASIANGPEPR
ncbi:MAG: WS/DGAT/MGAT family O-acyltransferase [Streptosporangiaceae bacterium]|jgi:diacylglycerol O-acyltransferase